jgi:hypothetical protein
MFAVFQRDEIVEWTPTTMTRDATKPQRFRDSPLLEQ